MSNSGRKINYAVRPAKNIERKMMRDLFLRLSRFGKIEDYRYIGFGSKYFSDFIVFHKLLNFSTMHSIEADVNNRRRYEFNKPYPNIKMEWGRSTEVLPELASVPGNTIYWLDYDGKFERFMLDDVAIVAETIESGGSLSISFNCEPINYEQASAKENIVEQLQEMVGKEFVDNDLDPRGWRSSTTLAVFIKNTVTKKIAAVLKGRNLGGASDNARTVSFQQLLFFTYADGANMATITYIFFEQEDSTVLDSCCFDDLYFVRKGDQNFDISPPNLTMKEIRHLMELGPAEEKLNTGIFALKDARLMWENYRYFPGFSEVESF